MTMVFMELKSDHLQVWEENVALSPSQGAEGDASFPKERPRGVNAR